MTDNLEILAAKMKVENALLNQTGSFSGVGAQIKEDVVTVYLRNDTEQAKKKAYELIGSNKANGHDLKFINSGNIVALSCPTSYTAYNRPVCGGVSCGHQKVGAGTLGGLVYDNISKKPLGLSNNHVLCFDKETEVLTKDGWKYFKDVTIKDYVVTLNKETDEIEYQMPIELHKYKYTGSLLNFKGLFYDLVVTPNHGMWCELITYKGRKKIPIIKSISRYNAEEIKNTMSGYKRYRLKKSGKWNGNDIDSFVLPFDNIKRKPLTNKIDINKWLMFFGIYLAEGSYTIADHSKYNAGTEYMVNIRNKDHDLLYKISSLLKDMGFNPFVSVKVHQLTVNNKQLCMYLKQFGRSGDKYIPKWIKELSSDKLKLLLDWMVVGDGCIVKSKAFNSKSSYILYCSKSKKLIDDIQEISLKIGYASNIKKIYGSGYNPHGIYYNITIYNNHKNPYITTKPQYIEYDDYVYDVTVPNHIIYVRRNGKPIWSGNSASSTYDKPQANLGDTIFSPGLLDSYGTQYPFGKLYKYVPLNSTANNFVDCALVEPDSSFDLNPEIIGIGTPQGWEYSQEGTRLIKSGRTSGITEGTIIDKFASLEIDYGGNIIRMTDTIVTGKTADSGDSGSLALNKSNNKVVGLLFAGSSEITCYNRIENVMNALDILILPTDTMPAIQATQYPSDTNYQATTLAIVVASLYGTVSLLPIINEQIQLAIHRKV